MTARSDTANAFETQLSAQMNTTDLTASVDDIGTLSTPCILVIDPDDDAKREFILFDGTFGASSFVTTAIGNRYLPGSAEEATPGITHLEDAVVSSIITQQHLEHLWTVIEANVTAIAALDADFAAHDGGTDVADHPEATDSVRGFMSAADKDKLDDLGDFRKFILHGGYMDFSNFVVTSNGTFWPYDTTIVTPSDWNSAYISAFAEIQTHLSELDGTTLVLYASDGSNVTTALVDQVMLAGDSMTMIAGGVHLDTLDTTTTLGLKVPVTNYSSDRSLFSFVVHYVMTRTS